MKNHFIMIHFIFVNCTLDMQVCVVAVGHLMDLQFSKWVQRSNFLKLGPTKLKWSSLSLSHMLYSVQHSSEICGICKMGAHKAQMEFTIIITHALFCAAFFRNMRQWHNATLWNHHCCATIGTFCMKLLQLLFHLHCTVYPSQLC